MTLRWKVLGSVGLALLGAGCTSMQTGARSAFVKQTSCPDERVTVTPRPKESLHTVPPPAEIASDPERLRLWQKNEREKIAHSTFFDVTGCGKTETIECLDADWCMQWSGEAFAKLEEVKARLPLPPPPLSMRGDASGDAALAALPRVASHYDVPAVPPVLQGLSVRPHATVVGMSGAAAPAADALCTSEFEATCALLGWRVVTDAASPADLDVSFQCNGRAKPTLHGSVVEIELPEEASRAVTTFSRGGRTIETFRRELPVHFACEASSPSGSVLTNVEECAQRIREMSRSNFIGRVSSSQALLGFAAQKRAGPTAAFGP